VNEAGYWAFRMSRVHYSLAGKSFLVTGASGFIGSHFCARLLEAGAQVHAISRNPPSLADRPIRWWRCNVAELNELSAVFHAVRADYVIHLASQVTGSRELNAVLPTLHANLVSTVNLFKLGVELGCTRMIVAGSLEEPEAGADGAAPCSPYAAAKWAASGYARMFHELYRLPVVVARLFMTYGPAQADLNKLIPYVTLALLRGQAPKLSSGLRQVDWIFVDDVVDGLLAIALAPDVDGETFDLGSGLLVPIRQVVEQLCSFIGGPAQLLFGALPDRPLERIRVADVDRSFRKLAWKPLVPLASGLETTVKWYRDHFDQITNE
jgi:UDP-glucose 4-epimerase